ncbi:hypothetical protein AK812_SmicGene36910 [Symbiodinium microadriaticum]|uniref:C3H1-type domain-containing protein n=1 Tax=Symbiodinium microadriaticum TaxID=2951 RepID=A0A1Q9CHM5_SYMMI|nr:hypothetical protein AK812_SmicGene36910 [Symbiodinium microadriaticum]
MASSSKRLCLALAVLWAAGPGFVRGGKLRLTGTPFLGRHALLGYTTTQSFQDDSLLLQERYLRLVRGIDGLVMHPYSSLDDAEAVKADLGNVGLSLQKSDMFWKQADSKFSEMSKRVGQLEEALAVQSRANASFEAGVNTKLDILHQMVQGMQASLCQVDALGGTVDSMKDAASQVSDVMAEYGDKLRAHEKKIQELSVGHDGSEDESESGHRDKTLERLVGLAKEEFMTKGDGAIWTQRLMDEQWEIEKLKKQHESTTTHLRELSSLLERVVANEQVVSKLQVRYEEINKQVVILSSHLSDDRVQEQDKVSRRPVLNMADRVIEQMPAEPSTPRTSGFGKPERFLMTPEAAHQSGLETDNGWYDDAEEEELEAGKQLPPGLSTASPDVGNTRIPPGQWKLIKDFPRLVMPQGDPWEKGMAFRQWATEASALAEAISPLLAEFFRRRLREGQELYERRLRDGCTPPLPAVATSDKEMETRLSLALLKALPASMKQPALEKGSSDEAVSTVALLEAACEVFMPGGISEQVSLQRFLRQLPVANSCKELLGTLRRWRLAEQRAKYLKVPEQAPHESIAALDGLCKQLEKKYTLLGTRLSLMRLQHNIQVPTHDGVSSYLQILEAECTRICAEEQTASRGGSKQGDVGEYDLPAANQAAGGKGVKPLCAYYNTARGCLKGSACTFRHEKQSETSQKGKGAKGKDGKTGKGDKGATKSAEPKAKAKAEAKAAADSTQTPSPKAKTKAEKKAAKAAAKAAASTAATAQESEDIPALAGAACAVQESSSKPHAMMARSWNVEPDSDSDDEGNIPEIPMRADGDTPEWSEVERGEYSSEEAQSDGSDAWIDFQRQPEPLWTLELSVTEYIQWRRPGVVHSRASHEFVETTNPNSICWPLWWRIVHDELDENERGTISVVDGVDILRCDIAQVMFEDQIARWLMQEDFKPIRIMLSKYFKGRSSSALTAKASGGDDGWTECETCTLVELMQHTWDDEVAYVGAELKDDVIQNEAMAREVLSKGPITYQDVWEVLRSAALPTSPKRPRMWVFGYYCHGGIVGITNLTRQRPNLCKLFNAFLQQELPDFTYAAFQIAVDAALAPHRDITNEVGSMSGLIGVSRFEGGRLWVEDRDGMVKRRVAGDEIKVGKLLTVSQQACTFNARAWHGADRHKGVRGPTPQQAPAEIKPGKEFVGGAFLKEAHPFAPKAEEGIFLANDERTPGGARVMVVRDERNSVRVVRMPVLIDKQSSRWRLEKGPRDQVVWISTCGDIRWDAPPSDLITVEEATGAVQAWNDGNTASEIIRQRFKAHLKPELLFSLFGHGFLIGPEPGEPVIAAAGKQDVPFQEESKENWYRVFDAGTEDAMNEMEVALRLLAEEEITGEPVPSSIFFTGTEHERQPWIKAAEDEVSNMTTNAAWVEVNINNAREELGLGPHERLPKVLPMTVVCTRKPLLMQDDKCESNRDAKKVHDDKGLKAPQSASEVKDLEQRRFKAKVRLCVCGNFEEVKPEMKDANAAETVPVEVLRLLLTLLTMHLTWSALSLDISAAFLNAVLTGKDIILMQPPKSLVRLGLIPEGVWLRAMRAIYGLRQSPARWEELRDSILDGAVLEAAAGDLLPTLVIRAMKGIGGVFLITTRDTQQLVAVACVFVDDVLAIGETEAILRIGEFILKSWKGRLQGMLSRETAQAWMRGTLEVKAKSELVFVGIQMFFRNGGVAMSQQRWVVKQLNVRGYLHLGGSPCLPQVEEGYLLRWGENTLMYKSVRQTLTAFSTCEAETGAMADAIADMLRIESYVTQVGEVSEKLAWGDNAASVACLTKPRFQETLWRTRTILEEISIATTRCPREIVPRGQEVVVRSEAFFPQPTGAERETPGPDANTLTMGC